MRALTPPVPGSPGSVWAQSTLVFGHGEDAVSSDTAEQQLRNSLDQNGFIRDLQLVDIQSERELRDGGVRGDGALGGRASAVPPRRPSWALGWAQDSLFASACAGQHGEDQLAPHPGGVWGPFVPALWHSHTSRPLAGTAVVTSPAPVSAVPDWAIALLVLVSILLLLSILTCFLMVSPLAPSGSSACVPCPVPTPSGPRPLPSPPRPPAPAAGRAAGSWTCSTPRIPTTPWPSTRRTRATAAMHRPPANPTPTAR